MEKVVVNFNLNGKDVSVPTVPNKRLVDFLRDDCGCLSVKEGCGEGECGACTIILDGVAITSCLMMAPQAEGKTIVTVEGVCEEDGSPNYIQQAFIEAGAVQCGFCIPGMILSAKALLDKIPDPTHEQIKKSVSGNLCRCTGYAKIIKAIELARDMRKGA